MSILSLLRLSGNRLMPHASLVKPWWPKPVIKAQPEKYWGTKWTNGTGLLHKYVCTSFSSIGFYTRKTQIEGLPSLECFTYGESPEEAYDRWCELFNVWNKEEEWVE